MNFQEIKNILQKHIRLILIFPFLLSLAVILFTLNSEKQYLTSGIVYTGLASGYDISREENKHLDFFAVNNAFDNLISTINSRETLEETAMRLMAIHMVHHKPVKGVVTEEDLKELSQVVPPRLKSRLLGSSAEETFQNIRVYKESKLKNEITDALHALSGIYSINQIRENLKVEREKTSDMLKLSFTSGEPARTRQTLSVLIDVFITRYKEIKGKETNKVVTWFEDQLDLSLEKLRRSEENLKKFSVENKIINFEEQTKFLAEAKEQTIAERELEKNRIAAARANRADLEKRIGQKKDLYRINEEITTNRKQLSDLQYRITNAEVLGIDQNRIGQYRAEAEQLKSRIDKQLNELHQYNNEPSGLPREALLNSWLANSLEADGGGSRLNLIENRLNTFDNIYSKYAPLGATLNALKREVEVAEKEYLNNLNGLNQARLRRQNLEMTNNLATLDAPFYPLKPLPERRTFLVLLSFVIGTVLAAGWFILREFLDNSVKNVENAVRYTGSEVLAALPDFNPAPRRERQVPAFFGRKLTWKPVVLARKITGVLSGPAVLYREELKDIVFNHILGSLSLKFLTYKIHGKKPKYLNIYSHNRGEGSGWFATSLAAHLSQIGNNVCLFVPENTADLNSHGAGDISQINIFPYPVNKDFLFADTLESLVPVEFQPSGFDYIINILPPFKDQQIPATVLENADINILVVDAGRVWTPFDRYLNDLCKRSLPHPPLVVLNRTGIIHLESVYGQITDRKNIQTHPYLEGAIHAEQKVAGLA